MNVADWVFGKPTEINGQPYHKGPNNTYVPASKSESYIRGISSWFGGKEVPPQPVPQVPAPPPVPQQGVLASALLSMANWGASVVSGAYSLAREQIVWTEAYLAAQVPKLSEGLSHFENTYSALPFIEQMRGATYLRGEANRLLAGAKSNPTEVDPGYALDLTALLTNRVEPLFIQIRHAFDVDCSTVLLEIANKITDPDYGRETLQKFHQYVTEFQPALKTAEDPLSDEGHANIQWAKELQGRIEELLKPVPVQADGPNIIMLPKIEVDDFPQRFQDLDNQYDGLVRDEMLDDPSKNIALLHLADEVKILLDEAKDVFSRNQANGLLIDIENMLKQLPQSPAQ